MDKEKLNTILVGHKKWWQGKEGGERADLRLANLQGADLQDADLQDADLRLADLRGADLQGANLDFSCWPLWCGSRNVKVDNKLVFQLAAHICVLDCDSPEFKAIKEFLLPYAKQCHRAAGLGLT